MEIDTSKKVVAYDNVQPKAGGPYSLYCSTCGRWIPNMANHEMRKEGYFAHDHICVKYDDGTIEGFNDEEGE